MSHTRRMPAVLVAVPLAVLALAGCGAAADAQPHAAPSTTASRSQRPSLSVDDTLNVAACRKMDGIFRDADFNNHTYDSDLMSARELSGEYSDIVDRVSDIASEASGQLAVEITGYNFELASMAAALLAGSQDLYDDASTTATTHRNNITSLCADLA